MTIWEALFGTPERAANTLDNAALASIDYCCMLGELKCANCPYEYDRYGCEHGGMTELEWLNREVEE